MVNIFYLIFNLLDYALGVAYTAAANDAYSVLKDNLCTQILTNADTTILNEPEGLDLYIDVAVDGFTPTTSTIAFTGTSTPIFQFIFGFKKKSSPAC